MNANDRQIGGRHYKSVPRQYEHWTVAVALGWGYLLGTCTKYLWRYRDKGGIEDLEKAAHYLQKLIEAERAAIIDDGAEPGRGYVDQDR